MNKHYVVVASRARHRCEYCHAPEVAFNLQFEVDHIIPLGSGGADDVTNYALGCRSCNVFKSNATTGVDPVTGEHIGLFNPRADRWELHFVIGEDGSINGATAAGRATIEKLHINSDRQLAARRRWSALGLFP